MNRIQGTAQVAHVIELLSGEEGLLLVVSSHIKDIVIFISILKLLSKHFAVDSVTI